jgi:hypothetical protein
VTDFRPVVTERRSSTDLTSTDEYGDLAAILAEFFNELMGIRSSYCLDDLGALDSSAEADAMIRLRLRIAQKFIAQGWQPPDHAREALDRDRVLLEERAGEDILLDVTPRPSVSINGDGHPSGLRADASSGRKATLANSQDPAELKVELEQMHKAMMSRAVIEQAKGIAMERYGLPADVAWSWLVRTSQQRNEKLRALAETLVQSVNLQRSQDATAARPTVKQQARHGDAEHLVHGT